MARSPFPFLLSPPYLPSFPLSSSLFSLPSPSPSSPLTFSVRLPFLGIKLEVGGLFYSSYGVWGSAVSFLSEVWGRAPTEIDFDAFWP